MKIEDFAKQFPQKLQELTDYVNSEEIKDIIGVEAVNHFKGSFDNEGFTDETLNPCCELLSIKCIFGIRNNWKSVEAQGWATNRAETAEVFTQAQQYINKFPQKGGKFLDDLTAQKWGLETVQKLKDKATADAPVTKQTAKEVWSDHSKDGDIKLNLFNNRKVTLTKDNFDAHTTAKKDDRTIYFDALKETLQAPDELWLNNEKKIDRSVFRKWIIGDKKDTGIAKKLNYDNFNAIKFYKDEAIVANYRITNGELELRTWYRLYPKKKVWDKIRRGLFIKQKKSSG